MMPPTTTVLDAINDPHLLGAQFGSTWQGDAWRAFLAALFNLPMTEAQQAGVPRLHGPDRAAPTGPAREAWVAVGDGVGRKVADGRGGIAVFLAAFKDYRGVLAGGEVGTLPVIAADRRQARVGCFGLHHGHPGRGARCWRSLSSTGRRRSIELSDPVQNQNPAPPPSAPVRGYTCRRRSIVTKSAFFRSEG